MTRFRRSTSVYPRDWRVRYGEELRSLLEELEEAGEPRWRLTVGVLWAAAREQVRGVAQRRAVRIGGSAALVGMTVLALLSLSEFGGLPTLRPSSTNPITSTIRETGTTYSGGVVIIDVYPRGRVRPCRSVAFSAPVPPGSRVSGPVATVQPARSADSAGPEAVETCSYRVSYPMPAGTNSFASAQIPSSLVVTRTNVLVGPD